MTAKADIKQEVTAEILGCYLLFLSQYGTPCMVFNKKDNSYVIKINSRNCRRLLRKLAYKNKIVLTEDDLTSMVNELEAHAYLSEESHPVNHRIALIEGGIEIDLVNDENIRVRVTANGVELIESGSETLLSRSPSMKALVTPASEGDFEKLTTYLNISAKEAWLLIAWITYTLAHPKIDTSKYVILVVKGDQGSGKTFLCNTIIQMLLDPGIGVQSFPSSKKDLAIAAQNSHLLMYDNLRKISPAMADTLCMTSTSGSISTRQLYTDAEESILQLHVAIVLNGIHSFVNQPDLAQRSLTLHLLPIDEKKRQSESELSDLFQAELPEIFRGLLDLIAKIFSHLPCAEVTHPERMIDFSRWLAAMELALEVPKGSLQSLYSANLNETIHDSLTDNALASAVLQFAEGEREWHGTPTKLLKDLNFRYDMEFGRSREWPSNPIALSKRLKSLKAGLLTQGVDVRITRGKERQIAINFKGNK